MEKIICINSLEDLKNELLELKYRPINLCVAETIEKYDKADITNSYQIQSFNSCYKILLHPTLYSDIKDELENILQEVEKIQDTSLLEEIKNIIEKGDSDRYSYNHIVTVHNYNEKIIREMAEITKNTLDFKIQFIDVFPSEQLLFFLRKNRTHVEYFNTKENFQNYNGIFRVLSNNWFTSKELMRLDSYGSTYMYIPYDKLLSCPDCIDMLQGCKCIKISNITSYYKMETNSIYLTNAMRIAKRLRDYGYDKQIIIYCDSMNDISELLSFCETENIDFSCLIGEGMDIFCSGGLSIESSRTNNSVFKYECQNMFESDLSVRSKLKKILEILFKNLADNPDMIKYEYKNIFGHAHDLCRFFGLDVIQCFNPRVFFVYEPHNPKIIKFSPEYIKEYFEKNNIDISSLQDEDFSKALNVCSEIKDENVEMYEKYLNEESVEKIKQVFIESLNVTIPKDCYYNVDFCLIRLKLLISILMDISEDKYLEFKGNYASIVTYEDAMNACEFIANEIINFKRQQIGIVITQKTKRK